MFFIGIVVFLIALFLIFSIAIKDVPDPQKGINEAIAVGLWLLFIILFALSTLIFKK